MFKTLERRKIEKLKNVILVVLFLTSILLLCFFWQDISIEDFSLEDFALLDEAPVMPESILTEDVLVPAQMVLSYGEGVYCALTEGKERYWNDPDGEGLLQCIIQFSQKENMLTEEITKEQYNQYAKGRALSATFDFYIPFNGFCDEFGIKKAPGSDNIDGMAEIGYSLEGQESVFLRDGRTGKCYRMVAGSGLLAGEDGKLPKEEKSAFEKLLLLVQKENQETYYPINTILGEEVENTVLIPLGLVANAKSFTYQREFSFEDKDAINEVAKSFFGDSFDFIRKIEEASGAVIYMYGYGEKVLIADVDGTFEYKEEQGSQSSQLKYFDALSEALRFVSTHGGLDTAKGQKHRVYLKDVTVPTDRKENYKFVFGIRAAGEEIHYQSGEALVVEVAGSQVSYYKRDFIEFDRTDSVKDGKETFDAVNMLAQNREYIYEKLVGEGLMEPVTYGRSGSEEDNKNELFKQVAEQIGNVSYGYVRLDESEEIQPAWIVTLQKGRLEFYFGLYDAKPLGYRVK